MTFNEYQEAAHAMAVYPHKSDVALDNIFYPALGLAGEVGEVIEPIKKWYRGTHELDVAHIELEMGDVLWYLAELATRLGISLDDIARKNQVKLTERRKQRDAATLMRG